MDSYDVIAEAVKDYWKVNYPQDVVAFFQQKYSWDDKWEKREELVECYGSDDYENMAFLYDFCEGQTDVKDVVIIPLREVTAFYYNRKIENHETGEVHYPSNADRIRSMSDEELAAFLLDIDVKANNYGYESADGAPDDDPLPMDWLEWLRQEVSDGNTQP